VPSRIGNMRADPAPPGRKSQLQLSSRHAGSFAKKSLGGVGSDACDPRLPQLASGPGQGSRPSYAAFNGHSIDPTVSDETAAMTLGLAQEQIHILAPAPSRLRGSWQMPVRRRAPQGCRPSILVISHISPSAGSPTGQAAAECEAICSRALGRRRARGSWLRDLIGRDFGARIRS
jgi:hypothetical protein